MKRKKARKVVKRKPVRRIVSKNRLLEFYGKDCPHCIIMEALIAKLQQETGIKIEKLEVWYNNNNMKLLKKYDKGCCGGVPFFYNEKTGKWLCGAVEYDVLKNWALSN
ncbi:MAG: hypothetical protein QXH80_02570 [Candidatus Nanoarchaeia archaeon]